MSTTAAITGKTVLVTGANRGLGQALVDEALKRGAARVYAAARRPFTHPDDRVTSLVIDVTDREAIEAAAQQVQSLDILINNAGISVPDDMSDRDGLDRHLAVNLYGTLDMILAFLPALTRSRGEIVNVISIAAIGLEGSPAVAHAIDARAAGR
jgi:NAD(P)-dependent dehydrogenase (short-subunit alcohol dehydrogenase family)